MLGPFRIRNLRRAPPARPLATPAHARPASVDDAVVCIDGDVYEQSAHAVPAVRLQYTDSDSDRITVGSKQELAERLAEPVASPRRQRPSGASVPLRPASPSMHVFEIDPVEAAIQFWRTIAAETPQPKQTAAAAPTEKTPGPGDANGHEVRYPSMEEMGAAYFRATQPPQLRASESKPEGREPQRVASDAPPADMASNVLTSEGIKQAQEAGERLRTRLMTGAPRPSRHRIDRADAVNAWARYSNTAGRMGLLPRTSPSLTTIEPAVQTDPFLTSNLTLTPFEHQPMRSSPPTAATVSESSRPAHAAVPETQPATAQSRDEPRQDPSASASGSLQPAFYENMQASLAKLSVPPAATASDSATTAPQAEIDAAEAVEITLAKMVFESIQGMTAILDSMNTQFDSLLTPKLVAERLANKQSLLPAHRLDAVNDIFSIRRSLEAFALETAEAKQILARLDKANVFPEGTNLIDFNLMTSATSSFGRIVRAMVEMVTSTRAGMLSAQLADGEAKYHIPRRLARVGFEDTWALHISPLPHDFTRGDLCDLVDELRSEAGLARLEAMDITFTEGPVRSAEIDIQGQGAAFSTWECMRNAPARNNRISTSGRELTFNRKHYPNVYQCLGEGAERRETKISLPPPSRVDLDVARLKVLQDRRAAWRREFKARTQSVRFDEPRNFDTCTLPLTNGPARGANPEPKTEKQPHDAGTAQLPETEIEFAPSASSRPSAPALHQKKIHRAESQLQIRPAQALPPRPLRRAQSARFSTEEQHGSKQQDFDRHPDPTSRYHRLRYAAGPFPPPPPTRSSRPGPVRGSVPGNQSAVAKRVPPPVPPKRNANLTSKPSATPDLVPAALFSSFPPLPPLKPLIPERVHGRHDARTNDTNDTTVCMDPKDKPASAAPPSESSGAFFHRMTGRDPGRPHSISPMASPTLPAITSAATQRSVSPISLPSPDGDAALPIRSADAKQPSVRRSVSNRQFPRVPPLVEASSGLRRSATVSARPVSFSPAAPRPEKSAAGPWSRRPYSEAFDGQGRAGGADEYFNHLRNVPPHFKRTDLVQAQLEHGPRLQPGAVRSLRDVAAAAAAAAASLAAASSSTLTQPASDASTPTTVLPAPVARRVSTASLPTASNRKSETDNNDPFRSLKVQACVDQLKQLGYGDQHNDGMGRLVMYAQITDGDLEATIDMIEEEREAWQEHGAQGDDDAVRDI